MLDRAGLTGDDGPSHNGVWDLSLAAMVPGLSVFTPRDEETLRKGLQEAFANQEGPTLVRYPKGQPGPNLPALREEDFGDVIHEGRGDGKSLLIISVGPMAGFALEAAKELEAEGHAVTVIDPGWVLPVSAGLVEEALSYDAVLTVEDGLATGGVGSELARLVGAKTGPPVEVLGVQTVFPKHKTRARLLGEMGLDKTGISEAARRLLKQLPA